jgi:hypothetical protein
MLEGSGWCRCQSRTRSRDIVVQAINPDSHRLNLGTQHLTAVGPSKVVLDSSFFGVTRSSQQIPWSLLRRCLGTL